MAADLNDFLEEFDDVSNQVARARHEDFARTLRRWFVVFEDAPKPVTDRVRWLMTLHPWVGNEEHLTKQNSGMGNSQLLWPDSRESRLSAQLTLFKEIAENRIEAWDFAFEYFSTRSNNINDTLHEMTDHLFDPMVTELRRYLVRNAENPLPVDSIEPVPASDRVVRIDHNQPTYNNTIDAIEKTAAALLGDNVVGPEDRDRVKFELDSGMLLLRAQTARLSAIETVLIQALRWLSENFAGAALGIAAEHALLAVLKLIGGS